jgi:hypothetical protein
MLDRFLSMTPTYLAAILAIILLLLALMRPTRFLNIEVVWTTSKVIGCILIGAAILYYAFLTDLIITDKQTISQLQKDVEGGAQSIVSGRDPDGDIRWCRDRSGAGLAPLKQASDRLKTLLSTKS